MVLLNVSTSDAELVVAGLRPRGARGGDHHRGVGGATGPRSRATWSGWRRTPACSTRSAAVRIAAEPRPAPADARARGAGDDWCRWRTHADRVAGRARRPRPGVRHDRRPGDAPSSASALIASAAASCKRAGHRRCCCWSPPTSAGGAARRPARLRDSHRGHAMNRADPDGRPGADGPVLGLPVVGAARRCGPTRDAPTALLSPVERAGAGPCSARWSTTLLGRVTRHGPRGALRAGGYWRSWRRRSACASSTLRASAGWTGSDRSWARWRR